jgi:hypothetical protein
MRSEDEILAALRAARATLREIESSLETKPTVELLQQRNRQNQLIAALEHEWRDARGLDPNAILPDLD